MKDKLVVVLIRDLIFETKIKSTAQAFGVTVKVARSDAELGSFLASDQALLAIVDLNTAPSALDGIRKAKEHGVQTLAFVSHVDQELAQRAVEAGADEVLPRSRFTTQLPSMLAAIGNAGADSPT